MTSTISKKLTALGKPYIGLLDIARVLNVQSETFYVRIRNADAKMKPEAFGAFRAGGTTAFTLDAGIAWAEAFDAYWIERKASRVYTGAKRSASK